MRPAAWLIVAVLSLGLAPLPKAQPLDFSSSDDPREVLQRDWWRRENPLDLLAGPSLIGPQWRAAAGARFSLTTPLVTAQLEGTVRGGLYGDYGPDTNEPYDLLRLVHFARLNTPENARAYVRMGPLERTRLGFGHLADFFNSTVAWDERTVGAEVFLDTRLTSVEAFADNVLADGVVGGRLGLRPLGWAGDPRLASVTVGLSAVHDRTPAPDSAYGRLTGLNADFSFEPIPSEAFRFTPFVSYAWYPDYGRGLALGVVLENPNFIDLARLRFRLALEYSGEAFIPGFVGSFYQVNNPHARILDGDQYRADSTASNFAGTPLHTSLGGNALVTELRLLLFRRFELWYFFRRHYGTQSLSEYHLRLFLQARSGLRVDVGMDRGGLRSFLSLFNDIGDQAALSFGTEYNVYGPFWVHLRARYTYERVGSDASGLERYLVQRRFEPFGGLRLTF